MSPMVPVKKTRGRWACPGVKLHRLPEVSKAMAQGIWVTWLDPCGPLQHQRGQSRQKCPSCPQQKHAPWGWGGGPATWFCTGLDMVLASHPTCSSRVARHQSPHSGVQLHPFLQARMEACCLASAQTSAKVLCHCHSSSWCSSGGRAGKKTFPLCDSHTVSSAPLRAIAISYCTLNASQRSVWSPSCKHASLCYASNMAFSKPQHCITLLRSVSYIPSAGKRPRASAALNPSTTRHHRAFLSASLFSRLYWSSKGLATVQYLSFPG